MNLLSILLQAAPEGASTPGIFGGGTGQILMIVLIFVIMYLFMIRPQQKKQKEIQKMREALKVGDAIITAGGVYGKIKDVNDTSFLIEIADGVKIKIDKASVFAAADGSQNRK